MSDLGMYLCRATEYCAETRNLIEDVIVSVQNRNFLSPATKKEILCDALRGMGFSTEQLAAFARCELPTEYQVVPVDVQITRFYRSFVRVPTDADTDKVKEEAKKQILENGDDVIELDPCIDIEEDDITGIDVEWDGVQYE